MHTQRALLLLAPLAALLACPSANPGEPTTETGATSTGPATSTGASTTADDTAPTDPGPLTSSTSDTGATDTTVATDTGSTGPVATDTGTSTGTSTGETGSTDTGDTDTGAIDCEVSWVVPEVAADLLATHDLTWVGCELTACGAEDAPPPGESSVLCAPLAVADVPLTYLGHMHINESGAFTTADIVTPSNFAWLDGLRHTWRYDDHVYILTETDTAVDQLEVFYTVRALEVLRTTYPTSYQRLVTDAMQVPPGPVLDGFGWKNRLRSVIVSFDASPLYIAAGLTVLDQAPVHDPQSDLDIYSNVAAISIDRETIRGSSRTLGSRPIYDKASDDENFLRYMREGLAETLVHELLHPRVDRLNSTDADMNELYGRRVQQGACAKFELEEALVASSSLLLFRREGGLSDTYLDYYDVVLDANLGILKKCKDYQKWVEQFSTPSGVDPRYDLRLLDLP